MNNKKAQMEIMGLVIIVILIALGLLFAIKFFVFKEPSNVKQKFVYEEQTSNMLSAMLKTNVCKGKETIESLLVDCAEGETIVCNDGKTSCENAIEMIGNIFEKTLEGPWQQDYEFSVKKNGVQITGLLFPVNEALRCGAGVSAKAAVQPLPLRTGTMLIKFSICSKV